MSEDDGDIDLFKDIDIDKIQDARKKEGALRKRLKQVSKLYSKKSKAIRALTEHILLSKEFQKISQEKYLSNLQEEVDNLPEEKGLNEETQKLIDSIEKENQKFLKNRNDNILNKGFGINQGDAKKKEEKDPANEEDEDGEDEEKKTPDPLLAKENEPKDINAQTIEIDSKKDDTWYIKIIKYIFNIYNKSLPFQDDMSFIRYNYNRSTFILFRIIRFLFIMSFITLICYGYLLIWHLGKDRKYNRVEKCKYGIFCIFFYSSFMEDEALTLSCTYAIWLLVFIIISIMFFFIISSKRIEDDAFFQNNKYTLLSSYLFTSWNFNVRNQEKCKNEREQICEEVQAYTDKYLAKIEGDKMYSVNKIRVAIVNIIFLGLLFFFTWSISITFFIRDKVRNYKDYKYSMTGFDIFADLLAYALTAAEFYFFPFLYGLLVYFEGWPTRTAKILSENCKRTITTLWGVLSLVFIYTYFTINSNTFADFISLVTPEAISFFGCPGKWIDFRHNDTDYSSSVDSYTELEYKSYSRCREEETGINYLFIYTFYFIFMFAVEGITILIKKIKPKYDETYKPFHTLLYVYTGQILFILLTFFAPYAVVPYPLVMFVIYKWQFYLLKKKANKRREENAIDDLNDSNAMLMTFMIIHVGAAIAGGYYYFVSIPHFYFVKCYYNGADTLLLYNPERWCGPVKSYVRVSSVMTDSMLDTKVIGWVVSVFQQSAFLMLFLIIIFCILLYRRYNPSEEYYSFILNRQKQLMDSFQSIYNQLVRRDVISSMLLKVLKKRTK